MSIKASALIKALSDNKYDEVLQRLYSRDNLDAQRTRYMNLVNDYLNRYGDDEVYIFSVPGRSEISGNHTDHNSGKVLAAAVDIDIIAIASPQEQNTIRIKSKGYREDVVDISETDPTKVKSNSSSAIIAGVCHAFKERGYKCGGFRACTTSDVFGGSGLSSSAAFEVMCGNILSHLYNDGRIPLMELAKIGKYAENVFFGKPCGLMDQSACAYGGFLYMDFVDSDNPFVEKLNFDLSEQGYLLVIVNTGGNHADLTDDYALVPSEMHSCAKLLGKSVLREVDEEDFVQRISYIRKIVGDRAILRALHFFAENKRVEAQRTALKSGDIEEFIALVIESGNSSFKFLQNLYTTKNVSQQGLSLAIALTERQNIPCRVHGGGFAGTIQAYVRKTDKEKYKELLESVFGQGCCNFLKVRKQGAIRISETQIHEGDTGQQ